MDQFFIPASIFVLIITAIIAYNFFRKPLLKQNLDTIYMDALNAMLLSDKRKAINLLSSLVKKDSEHINAYLQLGNLLRNEDTSRAIKIHQMLTVRQNINIDTKIEIQKSLALDYEQINDLSKAKIESEKILELDKSNIWANSFLLSLAEKIEDWDYAEKKQMICLRLKDIKIKLIYQTILYKKV